MTETGDDRPSDEAGDCFVLISNIPACLHTSDLRKFFSDFVETEKFQCFHFRHRPEAGKSSNEISESSNSQSLRFPDIHDKIDILSSLHFRWNSFIIQDSAASN